MPKKTKVVAVSLKIGTIDRLVVEAEKENRNTSNFIETLLIKHFGDLDSGKVTKIEI